MSRSPDLLALCAALALTGCGFTPMYGDTATSDIPAQLDTIAVQNIPARPGQMLRDALQDQLYTAGTPTQELYSLHVSYNINTVGTGIQQDSSTTYDRSTATANWTLTPIGDPKKNLAKGQAISVNAANVIDQQYFAITLETTTVNQQLADDIAQQIDTQLAAYFKSHPGA